MKVVPSYAHVLKWGTKHSDEVFDGEVVIQEKVDGSQFGFGLNEDGELVFRSHKCELFPETADKMFRTAIEYILSVADRIGAQFRPDTYFYCECLATPRHSTLSYGNVPTHHLMLFDVAHMLEFDDEQLIVPLVAEYLGIDAAPVLYRGIANAGMIDELLKTPSYLGNQTIEGVVVKNYGHMIALGSRTFPLMVKFVREEFQEQNKAEWEKANTSKGRFETYADSFCTEARWRKAIQHMAEAGELQNAVQDIGPLLREIAVDLEAEDAETIKDKLYEMFRKDIIRAAQRGFVDWYKELLENAGATEPE